MGVLRLLLALGVVFVHFGISELNFAGGVEGVQAFFLISGFYMALILDKRYRSRWLFYTNRALRIFPAYWVVLALTIFLVLGGSTYFKALSALPQATEAFLLLSNLFMFGLDWAHFLVFTPTGLTWSAHAWDAPVTVYAYHAVPQAWTLGVELTFYLLAPWLAERSNAFLLALIAAGLALRIATLAIGWENGPWANRCAPLELPIFLLGMLTYRAYAAFKPIIQGWPRYCLQIITAGMLLFTASFTSLPPVMVWKIEVTSVLFFVALAASLPAIFTLTKDNRADRFLGNLSYPLYISHLLVYALIGDWLPSGSMPRALVVFVACIAVAALLYLLVDAPIQALRERRIRTAKIGPPALVG